jgi:hypothetical protein
MRNKRPVPDDRTNLDPDDLGRLRIVNEKLREAEQWIERRSRELVTAYGLAAAQARQTDRLAENVEVFATILFFTATDEAQHRNPGKNVVMRIDIPIFPGSIARGAAHSRLVTKPSPPSDSTGQWCSLFLELYGRSVERGIADLKRINALSIDLALVQQQLCAW